MEASRGWSTRPAEAWSSAGLLYRHPSSQQFLPVHLVHGVVCISVVVKLHKTESVLDDDVPEAAVGAEESVQVSLPDTVAQTTDIHTRSHHGCLNIQ